MVKVFEKIDFAKESQLEYVAKTNPDQIEDGLVYLEHQLHVGRGFLDVLFVDSKGAFVAAELKIGNDDGILTQALKYYDSVETDKDRLASHFAKAKVDSPKPRIDPDREPRILLVAPGFSEETRKAARHVEPDITLLEYEYLRTRSGETGLRCRPVVIERESFFRPPVSVEKILAYIYSAKLRDTCNEVIRAILDIGGDDMDEPKGIGSKEIRFRYRNRFLANISSTHKSFYVSYSRHPSKWVEIIEPRDWQKHKEVVLRFIRKTYEALGGTPR
jgi:hypothetical protein